VRERDREREREDERERERVRERERGWERGRDVNMSRHNVVSRCLILWLERKFKSHKRKRMNQNFANDF